jgi:hypothetical protein
MTIEYLEKQLESWKRLLLLFLGAAATLTASTVGITGGYYFTLGWVVMWVILQLGAVPAGLILLFGKEWRRLPLSHRLSTAFGYLAAAWLAWLAIGFRLIGETLGGFAFIVFVGGVLGAAYLLTRRAHLNASEELFP